MDVLQVSADFPPATLEPGQSFLLTQKQHLKTTVPSVCHLTNFPGKTGVLSNGLLGIPWLGEGRSYAGDGINCHYSWALLAAPRPFPFNLTP